MNAFPETTALAEAFSDKIAAAALSSFQLSIIISIAQFEPFCTNALLKAKAACVYIMWSGKKKEKKKGKKTADAISLES